MKYPKIDTLYKRQFIEVDPVSGVLRYMDKGKSGNPLILGSYAKAEFESVKYWTVTEQVDGANIRVQYRRDERESKWGNTFEPKVEFGGRTDNAQIPADLYKVLAATFTLEKLSEVFSDAQSVVLFGEGYGGKIQIGSAYRPDPSFVLFDVFADGWWLKVDDVHDVALKLGIESVPLLRYDYPDNCGIEQSTYIWTEEQIWDYVKSKPTSWLSNGTIVMEGVIARSEPLMLFRNKLPIMFKLKVKDLL